MSGAVGHELEGGAMHVHTRHVIAALTAVGGGGADTASINSASVASAAGETGEAAQEVLRSASGLIEQSATL